MGGRILAAGMVTSLGLDLETSCAASRAGISRAVKLDYFTYRTPDTGEVKSAIGHAVTLLTHGFEGYARLVRLLAGALRDLARNARGQEESLSRARVFLSLPHPARSFSTPQLILDQVPREEGIAVAEEARQLAEESKRQLPQKLVDDACRLAGWRTKPEMAAVAWSGHAGCSALLSQALEDLSRGEDAVLVGGVDSYLDEETLTWLLNTGRLKTPALAAGLMPGEAAALLLLGRRGQAAAEVTRVAQASEEQPLAGAGVPAGRGLADALASLSSDGSISTIYSDHNGEAYRAAEMGAVLSRLRSSRPAMASAPLKFPAISFGDTGAASGAVALCRAASDLSRMGGSSAMISSTSDGNERAVVLMGAALG